MDNALPHADHVHATTAANAITDTAIERKPSATMSLLRASTPIGVHLGAIATAAVGLGIWMHSQIADLRQQIGDLKQQIAVTDAQKNALADSIRDLRDELRALRRNP